MIILVREKKKKTVESVAWLVEPSCSSYIDQQYELNKWG
jgi:hypothetical protein